MKTSLLYRDQEFDLQRKLPWNEQALTQDLELPTLFNVMSREDEFLLEVVRKVVLSSESSPDTITYRQNILKDCLKNPSVTREMYAIAVEAIEKSRKSSMFSTFRFPSSTLYSALHMMEVYLNSLKRLRAIADEYSGAFVSEGISILFAMLKKELSDEYFNVMESHLKALEFSGGILLTAELGEGNRGANFVLRKYQGKKLNWIERIFAPKPPLVYTVDPQDEGGAKALSGLHDRGINQVANVLAQSAEHMMSFFTTLKIELAFYVACLNLHEQLSQLDSTITFPVPAGATEKRYSFQGLYDVSLALTMKKKIVGNDMSADNKGLVIVTGANQGGKSVFLRSLGLAQLMMQCGMFVPADSFCSSLCDGLFTHYKRKEDSTMKNGKLEEELGRMSEIIDHVTPNSILLLNESFAATNEREGSEIAKQIVTALIEKGVKVFYVTHLYEFAYDFYDKNATDAIFLRAERQPDGKRTFKIIEGEPLETSFGEDIYNRIFSGQMI